MQLKQARRQETWGLPRMRWGLKQMWHHETQGLPRARRGLMRTGLWKETQELLHGGLHTTKINPSTDKPVTI